MLTFSQKQSNTFCLLADSPLLDSSFISFTYSFKWQIPSKNFFVYVIFKNEHDKIPLVFEKKITYEWTVRPGTSCLCFSIHPIESGTIKEVPGAFQLDCVWMGQCHVYWWVKIFSEARWQEYKDTARTRNTQSAPKHHRTSRIPRQKHYGVGRDFIRMPHDLHIFKQGFVMAVQYWDVIREPIVRL